MKVVKRDGTTEDVSFDKILKRIQKLSYGLNKEFVDPVKISQRVINGLHDEIRTSELDVLAAQTCAYMAANHPDFSKLAARIEVSNLHKNTDDNFLNVCTALHTYKDAQGRCASLIADWVYTFVKENAQKLQEALDYERDFEYDIFGFKTLERSYLLRIHGQIVERPQHMLMRVACGIHGGEEEDAVARTIETYDLLSRKLFTHATPTLFNAGTCRPQMSSCFLLTMKEDSIEGIFDTLKQCAMISKHAGGIGLAVHNIRAQDSYIRGTNGRSNGLVPMLRVFNDAARYVDQGGGKRKGSFAIYLEPWHSDLLDFLDLRKNHGKEEHRARDLFFGLWIPDLFMRRVKEDGDWTLMCPNECPGLSECWGEEFERKYEEFEKTGRGRKTVRAQWLWFKILESQIETGTPYMLYKDACNRKSNQQNLGCIKSSNLCTEIVEYTSPDETAVCNLASIALPMYVNAETKKFDFEKLHYVTKVVTKNLNRVIDRNYYPVEEARRSNMRHRPVGLGVQGFADALMMLRLPYESEEAAKLNRDIFETIYHAAVEASVELAEIEGWYETFPGSPASKGLFQFDLWDEEDKQVEEKEKGNPNSKRAERTRKPNSGMWEWEGLRKKMMTTGLRNSLLLAPMPTASTSQILGNNESFEPFTSNIYYRRVLSGEFFCVNRHLLKDLIDQGLWSNEMKQRLIAANGSVQNIPGIPEDLREIYKTVWEIKQKSVIDMAAERGPYIDQSQSLNIHMEGPTFAKLSSMHFYGWEKGLKTGVYYLRTQAAADAIKFTVDVKDAASAKQKKGEKASTKTPSTAPSSSAPSPAPMPSVAKSAHQAARARVPPVAAKAPEPRAAMTESADPQAASEDRPRKSVSKKGIDLNLSLGSAPAAVPSKDAEKEGEEKEGADKENTAGQEEEKPVVCRWRPKGLNDDEPCLMCSG